MPATLSNTYHQAYVLHKRTFKETSLIVELLVRDIGRKTLIAKGARRKKSQFSGILEPFNQLRVDWSGRSDLATLTRAERCNEPVQLSFQRLYCGMYLNELLINLIKHGDPDQRLFDHYQLSINRLQVSQDLESELRQFELTLLEQIGYHLQLENEAVDGQPIVEEQSYQYLLNQGLVSAENVDHSTISGSTLIALSQNHTLKPQQRREAKQLLRRVIDYHLDGKPLRSRDLFRTIQSI